ncbi:efflux RND transporter permease subunit [Halovivax limisalsi]|uniref:efflux RND transporter permease subunit n=1 Tax=Halovivax limisalsi TaxID=1453760 RepID=UPI001FFDD0C0|nr:MMPL family transporter [Halovivax limisalsi]
MGVRAAVDRVTSGVTTHNRLVLVLFVLVTAGVVAGVAQDSGGAQQGIDEDALGSTDVYEAAEYIGERYGDESADDATATVDVYVRDEEESVLRRDALAAVLEYQLAVAEESVVAENLAEGGFESPANVVARELAGDPNADLETQRAALADASDRKVEATVAETFTGGEATRFFLPASYESGSTEADGLRMTIAFEATGDGQFGSSAPEGVQRVLYETADGYDDPEIFTIGQYALADLNQQFIGDSLWLVLPPILLLLVIVLGFAYRDVTDVVLGFVGTIAALAWTIGLMGWLGVLSQMTSLIVPVLIVAISIDFGFHVFMRYREERGPDEGIRKALARSTSAVAVAFGLVTITAAIGFLANLTSPVPLVRDLGIAITLGVVASLVVFTTLVPALKVSVDGLWERFGFDRRGAALGKGRYLERVLGAGVTAAERAAIPVIVVALVAGLAGGAAFVDLEEEPFQQADLDDVPEWQENLPGPMAFEAHQTEAAERLTFAQSGFQADREGFTGDTAGSGFTQILIEGEDGVATPAAMTAVATGHEAAESADADVVLRQGEAVHVVSPLSAMRAVAAENPDFAERFAAADENGDDVPDRDLEALYDAFYTVAPEQASQVIERTDDGTYASMLVMVPARSTFGSDRADAMNGIADEMAAESGLSTTAVGVGTVNEAELGAITDGIVLTMGLALLGVLVLLTVVYRVVRGSATLGAVTVLPIVLTLGLVIGGMWLLEQPLTMLTALLVSITIGLGIDYNIHVSDRFAHELERGRDASAALREAVTGTGGALLGSAVTSTGAFTLLILVPEPQFTSFGIIVALALSASFVLSVFVLPSLLWLWAGWSRSSGGLADQRSSNEVGDPAE